MIHSLTAAAAVMAIWVAIALVATWCFGKVADATLRDGPAE